MLNSLTAIADEFYSEDNNQTVPDGYNRLETNPFAQPTRLMNNMLTFPTH